MNKNQNIHIDELLAKWLAGEATDAELQELETWQEASEENGTYVAQFQKLWDHAEDPDEFSISTDSAWQKVQSQLRKNNEPVVKLRVLYRYAAALAASVTLFLLGWWFFTGRNSGSTALPIASTGLFIQAGDEAYTTTLPDRTVVVLQPHSSITADTGFGKQNRILTLKGSAHFTTEHGKGPVFTVRNDRMEVRDIGTAFWVYSSPKGSSVRVTQGSVQVLAFRDSAVLEKGDSAIIARVEQKLQVIASKTSEKAKEIKDKTLVFLKTELQKVTQLLNNTYHCDIRLGNPKIANCKLTATFANEDLDTVLDVIRETFNLEIKREGSIIYLEGKGCQ